MIIPNLLLAQKLRSSEDETLFVPTVRTFGVKFSPCTHTFVFSASERDFGHSIDENETSWGCNIPLQLSIEFIMTQEEKLGISSDICRNVCPKDVQSVYIHGLLSSSNFWESALGHFQDLRYLKVIASQTLGLALALSRVTPDGTESQDGYVGQSSNQLCAPGLEELELGHVSCWTGDDGEVVINRFRLALSIRKGQGRALKRLVINVCVSRSAFDPKYVLDLPVHEVWTNGKNITKIVEFKHSLM